LKKNTANVSAVPHYCRINFPDHIPDQYLYAKCSKTSAETSAKTSAVAGLSAVFSRKWNQIPVKTPAHTGFLAEVFQSANDYFEN